jgi:hypothetical protein
VLSWSRGCWRVVKKVLRLEEKKKKGRIRHTEGRAKLEEYWLKTHVRPTCVEFRPSCRKKLTEGLFYKFLKLQGG